MSSPGSPASARKALLRGREFGDRIHTFSCLSVLHTAVVTWNALHIGAASRRRIEFKIGARIRISCRRIHLELASAYPCQETFRRACANLCAMPAGLNFQRTTCRHKKAS